MWYNVSEIVFEQWDNITSNPISHEFVGFQSTFDFQWTQAGYMRFHLRPCDVLPVLASAAHGILHPLWFAASCCNFARGSFPYLIWKGIPKGTLSRSDTFQIRFGKGSRPVYFYFDFCLLSFDFCSFQEMFFVCLESLHRLISKDVTLIVFDILAVMWYRLILFEQCSNVRDFCWLMLMFW